MDRDFAKIKEYPKKDHSEIVSNEAINRKKAIQIYRKDTRPVIQSAVPFTQVEI